MSNIAIERRRRERISLRSPLEIFVSGESGTRRAITRDMSSSGVYFISAFPFSPGERLLCEIEITPRSYSRGTDAVCLECVLEVVRVERTEDAYGLGCRILRYLLRRAHRHDDSAAVNGFGAPARM